MKLGRSLAATQEISRPLESLDGQRLGPYGLKLLKEERLPRRSGWRQFLLALSDSSARIAPPPVIEGIYSAGGKGVGSWLDIEYREVARFAGHDAWVDEVNLGRLGLDVELFKIVGALAQSHMMVAYEIWGESYECLRETARALQIGIPPIVTPIGHLLFMAGFRAGWKDWYIAEGGAEGPKKLQAERGSEPNAIKIADEKSGVEIISLLASEPSYENFELENAARYRALGIANELSLARGAKALLDRVKQNYMVALKDEEGQGVALTHPFNDRLLNAAKASLRVVKEGLRGADEEIRNVCSMIAHRLGI